MRTALTVVLCIVASPAFAADREIPYEDMHDVFARVAKIPAGKYFHVDTRFESQDPDVATKDITLVIRSSGGDIPVPVAADGAVRFPVRDDLEDENPPMVTNVADGLLQLHITMAVDAPPEQRFRYELIEAMRDDAKAALSHAGFMVRWFAAPDFKGGLVISFPPGTAATAVVEASRPWTIATDAEGRIRIPDRKVWRKENPVVTLSAMPLRIALEQED